ncbi:Cdv3-like protein [Plakobranchus ocellatus]|uniref:Cdv3-like protein n=1 Tax=Plakobranchus ocellatus TaxID=259542 RepID=A0AAV3Z6T4_9GAST|nr:Cdv3-like protein [Plakobranchus ocellatus]
MADSSLDDFFAKKDKSKKKQKTKVEGDDTAKQTKKEKKKKEKDSGLNTNNILSFSQEDDEWKDFEEEKKADYTGLRIQTLQIASKEEQDKESGEGDDDADDEDGESRGKKDGASGPWAKNNSVASETSQSLTASQPEATKESAPAPKGPSKYIPPAQRNMSATSSHPMSSSRRKKEAPNMNSEEDFPTLGGNPASRGQSSYDYIDTTGQRKGVSLTLENKFSALQD